MSRLYFCSYNNYYTRKIKVAGTSVNDYSYFIVFQQDMNHNFNVNDGVVASCTCNSYATLNVAPDYLLVTSDTSTDITSRWFIMEAEHTSGSQYKLTLRRDICADFKDNILQATSYIEKGYVRDDNDLIFNEEPITFNQILKGRYFLKDKTGVSWITLYTAVDNFGYTSYSETTTSGNTATTVDIKQAVDHVDVQATVPDYPVDYTVATRSAWAFNEYLTRVGTFVSGDREYALAGKSVGELDSFQYYFKFNTNQYVFTHYRDDCSFKYVNKNQSYSIATKIYEYATNPSHRADIQLLEGSFDNVADPISDYVQLTNLNGKTIKFMDETSVYRIRITDTTISNVPINAFKRDITNDSLISAAVTRMLSSIEGVTLDITSDSKLIMMANGHLLTVDLDEVDTSASTTIHITGNHAYNSPYRIIQIPYKTSSGKGITWYERDTGGVVHERKTKPSVCYGIAQKMIEILSSTGALYDVQLLPYSLIANTNYRTDIPTMEGKSGLYFDTKETGHSQYEFITPTEGTGSMGFVAYCPNNSIEFDIDFEFPITNYKVDNQVEFIRLCAPTYSNCYEMIPARNDGIDVIHVSMTAKPYTPYIRLAPNFKRLYGSEYDKDNRGLIITGDLSLPRTSDAWLSYQAQNATYMQTFNRGIEKMDVERDIQRTQQIWGIAANSITGALAGAKAGSAVGGPIGSGVGAVLGLGASVAGGMADYNASEKLYKEGLDYTKDMFNYSLQNIQARPDTLISTGADNIDNPYFPFLEWYRCTDVEEEAFRNKIKYNGMTVNVIGKFEDYIDPIYTFTYVKGSIIDIDVNDDYHLLSEIGSEMYKGVYIYK